MIRPIAFLRGASVCLSAALLLLGGVSAFAVGTATVDLGGATFGKGIDSHLSSGATVLPAASSYDYVISGTVHGTGLLSAILPNGTQLSALLEKIQSDGGNVQKYVDMAKDKNSNFKLMGFGHRVYRNFDPRAKIIKSAADSMLAKLGINDPLLDVAKKLEEAALTDSYFVERKLYPNVDFYSGIIYRALGIPTNMFTVMFALGRLPGWIAHWKEMLEDPTTKIGRPRQVYTGAGLNHYTPIADRK